MTATLPDGMEYKNLNAACIDAASGTTSVWGSEYPEEHGVRNHIVAVTGVRDEVGDIIVPGAFIKTLQRITPKACLGHDWNRPIGYPEAIEELLPGDPRLPREDRFGKPWNPKAGALCARTRYNLDKKDGQDAYADATFYGPRLATSIGYVDPKDDNGKPLHSYKAIDPDTGLMTRFLPELHLFEYSQVLHGAHLLAGGLKDGKPKRLERKQRPDMELKVRLVRDSAYWGLPLGTPIRPGMKPQGPKARRLVAAGRQADEGAGAVEVDANNLRVKPTAKGKQKGSVAIGDAYDGILTLLGDDDADPFDESFLTDDTEKINKGEQYNPLDILVANAVPPADVEDQLRNNSDWDIDRLGDAADRQDEIDSYVADVVDAYREKYNAELVRQNDTGDSEVTEPADGSAEDTEVQPGEAEDARTVNEQEEDRRYQAAADRAARVPTQGQQRVQSEANRAASQRGEMPLRPSASEAQPAPSTEPAGPAARISAEDQAEIDRLKRDGRDNEAAKLYREAVQRARAAEGVTPEQVSPTRARLREEQISGTAPAPSLEDGRTMRAAEPKNGETQAFELTGDNGATLRVYSLRRPADPKRPWTFDIITADGETIEGESTFRSPGSALVRAEGEFHEAEAGDVSAAAEQDRLVPAPDGEPVSMPPGFDESGPRQSGYAIPPPPGDEQPSPAGPGGQQEPAALSPADEGVGKFPDGTKPSPKLIAALGNATWVTGQRIREKNGDQGDSTADGWLVQGSENTVFQLFRKKIAESPLGVQSQKGARGSYLLTEEGARLMAPYLPDGGKREGDQAAGGETPEALPDSGDMTSGLSTEVVPEAVPGGSTVAPEAAPATAGGTGNTRAVSDLAQVPQREFDAMLQESRVNLRKARDFIRSRERAGARVSAVAQAGYDQAEAHNNRLETENARRFDANASRQQRYDALTPEQQEAYADLTSAGRTPDEALDEIVGGAPESEVAGPDPDAVEEPLGETDPAVAEAPLDEVAPEAEPTEEITPDEIIDTEEAVDASFGVAEAPDGEFEVDADIADRQDRVATLLAQSETGGLDLSGSSDDQLRGTRADIVDEIRLQQHLERRRTGERAITRQEAETQATDSLIPQEEAEQPVDTGPKPRPGVAGAAEDYADALEANDPERADAARARLDSALRRSRSDSEVVAELRDLAANQELSPTVLRDIVERLREEQRAKRNEGARRRRAARRFERERLRALLSQVEAEMRARDLDYDPLPDEDGNVTLDLDASAPVAWTTSSRNEAWSGTTVTLNELSGANYGATIEQRKDGSVSFTWSVTDDNGTTLAKGNGTAPDTDSARASVEIALDTQRKLGVLPIDAQIPQESVPQDISATPLPAVVDAVQQMRQRITDGRRLNPLTGLPDPFGDSLQPLPPAGTPLFGSPGAARKALESRGGRTAEHAALFRWDTAKITPGGAFVVLDNLKGKAEVLHTGSGGTFNPTVLTGNSLGKADLLRWAEIAEAIRDTDGNPVDWSKGGRDINTDLIGRKFFDSEDSEDGKGIAGIQRAAMRRLTLEKLAAGAFNHKLVQNNSGRMPGVTNSTRKGFVEDQHRALAQMVNVRTGRPSPADKKTLEAASGARTLAALGAPDAASVLLTRRSAELREEFGEQATDYGSALLDSLAQGYLGAYSPMRSHGERLGSVKPGEQVFLADTSAEEGRKLRSFRVLAAPRRNSRGFAHDLIAPVIDESNGDQMFLHVTDQSFRIEENEVRSFGHAVLGGDRGSTLVVVSGPGEEPPASVDDLLARQFDDVAAIPQDVLDAAAEALPESPAETARRRATPSEGRRPPRRASARAPRRVAAAPAEAQTMRNEEQLAQAQGRAVGAFLGMPVRNADAPVTPGFASLDEVREHLVATSGRAHEAGDMSLASSSGATVRLIDEGRMTLSSGGTFLISKDGNLTHARTGYKVWPPSAGHPGLDDLRGGGYDTNAGAATWVADLYEHGVFDDEQVDWGDAKKAVKQIQAISRRRGFSVISAAQRRAYLDGVLDSKRPRITDVQMLRGMAGLMDRPDMPNPETLNSPKFVVEPLLAYDRAGGYRGGSYGYDAVRVADSKAGASLAKRVALEVRVAEAIAHLAPLDAVRRLNRVADELDGQTIGTVSVVSGGVRPASVEGDVPGSLNPSEDLRAIASRIIDAFDENKISDATRFRRAGMVGQVQISNPKVTVDRRFDPASSGPDPLADEVTRNLGNADGIRFYRDENGMLHATFLGYDIADGRHSGRTLDGDSRALNGAIKLGTDGTLTVSFTRASRPVMIEAPLGDWSFTPEDPETGGNDEDISGPEIESAQVDTGTEMDTSEDIGGDESPADENEE